MITFDKGRANALNIYGKHRLWRNEMGIQKSFNNLATVICLVICGHIDL